MSKAATILPVDLIKMKAREFGLDPLLVAAICLKESSGNAYAQRFEPKYRWLFKHDSFAKKLGASIETEENGQKTSYGLMQVMGAVMRERGFEGWFGKAFDAETNIHFGCMHLAHFMKIYGNEADAIASYNAGRPKRDEATMKYVNQSYIDGVLRLKASFNGKL